MVRLNKASTKVDTLGEDSRQVVELEQELVVLFHQREVGKKVKMMAVVDRLMDSFRQCPQEA